MKIQLDKIELNSRINALGLKSHYLRTHCTELYFDTELEHYMVLIKTSGEGSKYSGKVMVPAHNVAAAQVSLESVPKHQPIGTPEKNDTPSGTRKKRSIDGSKSTIAERIEARAASKTSQD